MARSKRPRRSFTAEFKAEVVAVVRQPGNSAASAARDLDFTETAVREWVKLVDIDDGTRDGLTSTERAELAQLRREVRVLRGERDILKRATAFMPIARLCRMRGRRVVVGAGHACGAS